MRGAVLLLLACLGACSPAPEADLRLVTIHNAETGFSLRVRMGGIAERAGLTIGDVVYGLNHKQVRSLEGRQHRTAGAPRAKRLLRVDGFLGGGARQSTERRAAA